jgi:hypothetical protein
MFSDSLHTPLAGGKALPGGVNGDILLGLCLTGGCSILQGSVVTEYGALAEIRSAFD